MKIEIMAMTMKTIKKTQKTDLRKIFFLQQKLKDDHKDNGPEL